MVRKLLAATAALSLLASPVIAQQSAVAAPAPATEQVEEGSELRRGGILLPLLGLSAVVLLILALTDTWPFDEDTPRSP